MKKLTRNFQIVLTAAMLALPLAMVQAEAEGEGKACKPGKKHHKVLDQEEREKLRAAMKEVRDNPEIAESRKALKDAAENHRKALRAALLEEDPSLEPVLDKIKDHKAMRRHHWKRGGKGGKHLKNNPEVQAAREKLRAAGTDEEKKAARQELKQAMKEARNQSAETETGE